MEGLNVIRNSKQEVISISQTLYMVSDGSPARTSYDLIPSTVRMFFYEDSEYEYTEIGETVCGKIITWNPESDWFNEYDSVKAAYEGQMESYIKFWNMDVQFADEFKYLVA